VHVGVTLIEPMLGNKPGDPIGRYYYLTDVHAFQASVLYKNPFAKVECHGDCRAAGAGHDI
jgi:hypothetical protein